jgi:GMP synthase (glutamine-hydrolysing)
MKKFLLIQSRPEDLASDGEYQSILEMGDLSSEEIFRVRGEKVGGLVGLNPEDYKGVIIGGGPFTYSDEESTKSDAQKQFELHIKPILRKVIEKDIPCFAICYGIGLMTSQEGGVVSRKYGEPMQKVESITITEEGLKDPIMEGVENPFNAIVGHKEACEVLPESAVCLALGKDCPVQMMRFGKNVYVTQFHPEMDKEAFALRIQVYKNYGYFKPHQAEEIIERIAAHNVSESWKVFKNFVKKFK